MALQAVGKHTHSVRAAGRTLRTTRVPGLGSALAGKVAAGAARPGRERPCGGPAGNANRPRLLISVDVGKCEYLGPKYMNDGETASNHAADAESIGRRALALTGLGGRQIRTAGLRVTCLASPSKRLINSTY